MATSGSYGFQNTNSFLPFLLLLLTLLAFTLSSCSAHINEDLQTLNSPPPIRTPGDKKLLKINLKRVQPKKMEIESTTAAISNQYSYYYGEIGLGTPPQKLRVIFDTGSADLMVLNQHWFQNNNPEQDDDAHKIATYNSTLSSTYQMKGQKVKITYLTCELDGFVSNDDVTIGDIIIKKQDFDEATKEIEGYFDPLGYDGILGLAFQGSSFGDLVPVLYNMIDQGLIEQKIFSIWLKKFVKGKSQVEIQDGGIIIFGGYDPAHFTGEHNYVPVKDERYWEFTMNEVFLGAQGSGLCIEGCQVFIDSGCSEIRGPMDMIDSINQALVGDEIGHVDCAKVPSMPQVIFNINGVQYPLSTSEYIKISEGGSCSTVFKTNRDGDEEVEEDDPMWILGEPFMWKYHTIFDYEKRSVGLAVANDDKSSPISTSTENHSCPLPGSNCPSLIFWVFILALLLL